MSFSSKMMEEIRAQTEKEMLERVQKYLKEPPDISDVTFRTVTDEMQTWQEIPDPFKSELTQRRIIRVTKPRATVGVNPPARRGPVKKRKVPPKRMTSQRVQDYRQRLIERSAMPLGKILEKKPKPVDFKLLFQRLASCARAVLKSLQEDKWPNLREAWQTPTSNIQKTPASAQAPPASEPPNSSSKT